MNISTTTHWGNDLWRPLYTVQLLLGLLTWCSRVADQHQNTPHPPAIMLASWMREVKCAISPWVTLVQMSPMGKENLASLLFIPLIPENLQASENEINLAVSSLFRFQGSNLPVFLPGCILQSSPSPSPACRHAQDLLSHRPPLWRELSRGSCTTYVNEGATRTAQVTWSQTKSYTVFLLDSGDFRSTARASIILMNYWQDIVPVQQQDKKDTQWLHRGGGAIGKELQHFHAGISEPGTPFRDMFWCKIHFFSTWITPMTLRALL